MANRKKNKGTRMEPGFNPSREKRYKYGQGRKDAFGEVQYTSQPRVQQGTLFSHRALMNMPENKALKESRIGPRGYSKSRLDEVRAGLGMDAPRMRGLRMASPLHMGQRKAEDWEVEAGLTHQHGWLGGEPAHWMPEVSSDDHIYGAPYGIKSKEGRNIYDEWRKKGTHELLGTLARSSMPAEHLAGMGEFQVKPRHEEYAGTYHQAQPNEERPSLAIPARIRLYATRNDRPDQEMTVMHELGHHWSHEHSGDYGGYGTPQERGREEARADTYALQHYRHDPRSKPEYGVHFDPRTHTYGARGQAPTFEGGYKLAPHNEPPPDVESPRQGEREAVQRERQPMLDAPIGGGVFTERPKDVKHRRVDVPLQSGETRGGWAKTTEEAPWFGPEKLTNPQDAIYRHESFRNTQRVNRHEEARQRQEISQRWGVGRQFH